MLIVLLIVLCCKVRLLILLGSPTVQGLEMISDNVIVIMAIRATSSLYWPLY